MFVHFRNQITTEQYFRSYHITTKVQSKIHRTQVKWNAQLHAMLGIDYQMYSIIKRSKEMEK